jgi:hypothetical protein
MERKPLHALRPRPEGRGHFPFLCAFSAKTPSTDGLVELVDDELDHIAGGTVAGREPGSMRNAM